MSNLVDRLKPHVPLIETQALRGDTVARRIIDLYELWRACPNDRASYALCEASLNEWLKREALDGHKPPSSSATPTDNASR